MKARTLSRSRTWSGSAALRDDERRAWRVASAAAVVHALHVAVIYIAPSTLLSPMRAELGLTITQMALPLNAFRLVNCLFLVPAGAALDRVGASRLLLPSLCCAAVLAVMLPFARTLSHLVIFEALFACTKLFGGLSALLVVVSSAFGYQAGAPCAVVLAGWSAAGFVTPAVVGALAARHGWRTAFAAVAAAFTCIALPLAHRFLRAPQGGAPRTLLAGSEKVLTQRYVALLCMLAALSVSLHVVIDHLIVYLREDVGYEFQRCTVYLSLLNFVGLLSKLTAGWLSDRFERSTLLFAFCCIGTLACSTFVHVSSNGHVELATSQYSVLVFVILYGLAYSGVFTLITTALPEFGQQRMGLRSNLNLMFLFGFGSVGSFAAGLLRSATGSYAHSFLLCGSMWAVMFMCVALYSTGQKVSNKAASVGKQGALF